MDLGVEAPEQEAEGSFDAAVAVFDKLVEAVVAAAAMEVDCEAGARLR